MRIGHIIKNERLNLNMKQSYLANGICSSSYLSKIENNDTTPSNEIIEMLFNKLGISMDVLDISISSINANVLIIELLEVYKEVTINREKNFAKIKVEYYYENRFQFLHEDVFYTYNLTMLRLILDVIDNKELVELHMQLLVSDYHYLTSQQKFLLKKLKGIYFYQINMYSQALSDFDEAHTLISEELQEDWEQADFYYMYSLVNLANNNNINAIELSEKANRHFLENFQFKRTIECYTIQAISYKRSNKFNEAVNIYLKVIMIIEKFNLNEYSPLIYQNLGSLYSSIGEIDKAIEYYLKSLALKSNSKERLITIFSLIKVYSKVNNRKEILHWISVGLNNLGDDEDSLNYKNHFLFYREIHLEMAQTEDIELLSRIIDYFNLKNDYRHVYKYCIKLGDVLIDRNKYKNASFFYKKAINFNNMNQKLDFWEDI